MAEDSQRQLRGLYRNVKISVKTLDTIIIACILVIVVLLAIDLQNPGFTTRLLGTGEKTLV